MTHSGGSSRIWSTPATVLTGDPTADESHVGEPSIIYEANAQVLSGTVYKMWARAGWNTPHLNYYESTDGISWTAYDSNPIVTGLTQPFVFKDGSTYYLYYVVAATGLQFDMRTSSDGITWSAATTAIISVGAGGAWDDVKLGNIHVWKEGANDWRALYEATGESTPPIWKIGYATSSDGTTWSKSGSNPVISETGMVGGPFLYKNGTNDYWLWAHNTIGAANELPTDISRYHSTNLTTWTKDPVFHTLTRSIGNASATGQMADITMLTVGNQTYAWFFATIGVPANPGVIQMSIARLPMSQLIYTSEGY